MSDEDRRRGEIESLISKRAGWTTVILGSRNKVAVAAPAGPCRMRVVAHADTWYELWNAQCVWLNGEKGKTYAV